MKSLVRLGNYYSMHRTLHPQCRSSRRLATATPHKPSFPNNFRQLDNFPLPETTRGLVAYRRKSDQLYIKRSAAASTPRQRRLCVSRRSPQHAPQDSQMHLEHTYNRGKPQAQSVFAALQAHFDSGFSDNILGSAQAAGGLR